MEDQASRHANRQLLRRLDRVKRFQDDRYRLRLTHVTAGKLLDVSVRTIQNWESGKTRIPHSAFKLVRLLASGKHLDGPAWKDFHVRGDTLITPEGHTFPAADLAWWSLLFRQAEAFRTLSRQKRQAERAHATAGSVAGACASPEPGELVAVAKSLLKQVRSAPSSLPGRKTSSEAPQASGLMQASRIEPGAGRDAASSPVRIQLRQSNHLGKMGGLGGLSLTPEDRPKSATPRRKGVCK
ncbi:VC1465 family Xer recombination activation factor [Xanthomonas euvesicatoria]|uniref:VC1465 family Xer recombination activation factor n=1 Tax=Xanthomonas euvesicatoria TaxID=456327 RepID=UPI0004DF2ABD|nr:VC1465 family Xer recombination activation factor [Xanthomonas euvesicatoria]